MHPPTYDFSGRVVAVTGATGGLGPAVAEAFAAAGAAVALLARNQEKLEKLAAALTPASPAPGQAAAETPTVFIRAADLTDPVAVHEAFRAVAAHFGRVDVLLNLVGSWEPGKVAGTTDDRWHQVLATNLHAVFYAMREAVPHMPSGSAIVNVGNQLPVEGKGGQLAYGVAKGGVLTLTQSAAKELRERGIRVNAILPSNIDTPDNRRFRPHEDPALWPTPGQIARVFLYLASSEADLVSGALVPVYGRSW
jgi:NAD(P)-dependent dehydrogenase (short-subunit alcohol dehydrogenase family)